MNLINKLNYKILWIIIFGYFFILMLNITFKYFPITTKASFLQIKQTEVNSIPSYIYIFYIHVITSIFSLLAGFSQFNTNLLRKSPKFHRNIGKVYVIVVLFFSAPSGFYLGLFANGGLFSKISFTILAILWFYFTYKSYFFIRKRNIIKHKHFMYKSFALAFSAITLRLWKIILVYLFQPSPMDIYQIIAWLGWIPNLIIIELFIKNKVIK